MVCMLMSKQDSANLRNTKTAIFEPVANACGTDAGVYQQMSVATADNGGITLTAAGQYGKTH